MTTPPPAAHRAARQRRRQAPAAQAVQPAPTRAAGGGGQTPEVEEGGADRAATRRRGRDAPRPPGRKGRRRPPSRAVARRGRDSPTPRRPRQRERPAVRRHRVSARGAWPRAAAREPRRQRRPRPRARPAPLSAREVPVARRGSCARSDASGRLAVPAREPGRDRPRRAAETPRRHARGATARGRRRPDPHRRRHPRRALPGAGRGSRADRPLDHRARAARRFPPQVRVEVAVTVEP